MKEKIKEKIIEIINSVVNDAVNISLSNCDGHDFIEFDTSYICLNQLRSISLKLRNRLEIIDTGISFFPSLDDNDFITISIMYI